MTHPVKKVMFQLVETALFVTFNYQLPESRKHYGRTVIDRRKVCKTMEIWRKVCQNRDLEEGLDKHFNNKNWDKLLEETVICN